MHGGRDEGQVLYLAIRVTVSDLRNLLRSPPLIAVKRESHSMQGTPRMPPPQMPDISPLTQPRASIDAGAALTALEIILLKVRELVEEGRRV